MSDPKLFISYSWTDAIHEQWVIDLAIELRDSRVDVILDKWDLKEGHDSVAFMEKMVTDKNIRKVAIICDESYAKKADGRDGGVGTETQIISKEVYDNQEQDKFVAVISSKDENGKPHLPTYYKSRIYIDLSEPDSYAENFERLLRWVYDKPLYIKPELGRRPAFLEENEALSLGTTPSFKRALAALKESKPFVSGAIDEYLNIFSENLEKFRITEKGEFDELVVQNIEQFLPYRNEAIQFFYAIANYAATKENGEKLHRFFEQLLQYYYCPVHMKGYSEWDFDNFKFIVHELFLYAIAIFLQKERFELANILLTEQYYLSDGSRHGIDTMLSYIEFRNHMRSLELRNNRLKLNKLSLRADFLEQRSSGSGVEFKYLMQADFVLFLRSEVESLDDFHRWYPETLLYLFKFHGPFEIFARSISKKYFDKVKGLIKINEKSDLEALFQRYKNQERQLPRWRYESVNPSKLIGFENLATKP